MTFNSWINDTWGPNQNSSRAPWLKNWKIVVIVRASVISQVSLLPTASTVPPVHYWKKSTNLVTSEGRGIGDTVLFALKKNDTCYCTWYFGQKFFIESLIDIISSYHVQIVLNLIYQYLSYFCTQKVYLVPAGKNLARFQNRDWKKSWLKKIGVRYKIT